MHVFDHSFTLYAEHKVARVKVLKDDQWRPPMDSKHSSVAPTTESNLSSSTVFTGNTTIADIRKGTTKGAPLLKSAYSKPPDFILLFRESFFYERERESIFVDEMDSFFFFFNFLSIGWLKRKNENFFCILIYFYDCYKDLFYHWISRDKLD